jgi:hypothetical protein
MSLQALMALLSHVTTEMTLRYASLAAPAVRTAYEEAMGKARTRLTLAIAPAGQPIIPDRIKWLNSEDPAGLFGGTPRRFRSSGAPVVHDLLCGRLASRVAPCLAAEWCGHVDAAAALARCSRAHGQDGAFVVPAGEPGDADPR